MAHSGTQHLGRFWSEADDRAALTESGFRSYAAARSAGRGVRAMRRGQTEQPPGSVDTLLRLGQFRLDHAPSLLQGFHLSFGRGNNLLRECCEQLLRLLVSVHRKHPMEIPRRFASPRRAWRRFASRRSAPLRFAPLRFAPLRSASLRSGRMSGFSSRHLFQASMPFLRIATCSSFALGAPSAPPHILRRVGDAINQVGQYARRRTATRRSARPRWRRSPRVGRVLINAQIAAPPLPSVVKNC
jgi:hypothetical protein